MLSGYYDPSLGVFASLDPLETANRYAYVGGDPVNMVDPSGLIHEVPRLPNVRLEEWLNNPFKYFTPNNDFTNINNGISCPANSGSSIPGSGGTAQQQNTCENVPVNEGQICFMPPSAQQTCDLTLGGILGEATALVKQGEYLQKLARAGITIVPSVLQSWRESASNVLIAKRLCAMVTAIQDIGQDLLDAINQTPNCSRYANTSRPQDAITAFRDTLGEIRVNATQSAQNETSMSANPDGSLNIPSIAIRGLRNDCSPAKNCFYNIFVHELSHFIDYRATLAAGYSSDELLNRVVNEVTIPGQTVIGEDYIYHNPRNYNLDRGLTRINPAQTAGEYAADVLANLFLDAFDRQYDVADDQPSQRRLEQAQSLLSRAICGGTFLDTNGNPNVDSNN